jgi:NDP-sugar pyrophosphorylase family protein
MIERVTITMKKDMLKKIDQMVDKKSIRNRSHAIEHLIAASMSKTDLDTALIMAGGDGVNLRPITYELPKSLITIGGRPILEHQINMLKKFDIRNIVLSVGPMHEKIKEYFGNGSKFGVKIEYIVEEKPLGTAGALRFMKDYTKSTFLMLNVDTLMNPKISDIYNFHKNEKTTATVLLTTLGDPSSFGVVRMHGNQVLEFMEKPPAIKAPSHLLNAGLALFEKDVVKYVPQKPFMIAELFKKLSTKQQLSGFLHDGYIFDVGTQEGYTKAIKEWKRL